MIDALQFLTVIRVARRNAVPGRWMPVFFPVVGLLVGVLWSLTALVTSPHAPSTGVAAALVLVVDALITGGLHLDAFADVTDGVASRKPAAEAIRVMRDSAVGAIGAASLILICLLRFSVLIFSVDFGYRLVAAPVAGRMAMVALLWLIPPREDGSLAASFTRPTTLVAALALGVSILCAVPSGERGLFALVAALVFTGGYAWWWRRRFGTLTGDGVGAAGLLAETLALLVLGFR